MKGSLGVYWVSQPSKETFSWIRSNCSSVRWLTGLPVCASGGGCRRVGRRWESLLDNGQRWGLCGAADQAGLAARVDVVEMLRPFHTSPAPPIQPLGQVPLLASTSTAPPPPPQPFHSIRCGKICKNERGLKIHQVLATYQQCATHRATWSRGRSQTTVPRISRRHVTKVGAGTASLMYQRRQGIIGRAKTLRKQDELRITPVQEMPGNSLFCSTGKQHPTGAHQDDLTITAKSVPEGRWIGLGRAHGLGKDGVQTCKIQKPGSKLQLPVTSVVEEATKTHQAMMLRDSQDARVRHGDLEVRTGRKWSASRALREAEDRLQHADIIGSVVQGRLGLGCSTRVSWVKANPKERRGMVQREVRKAEEKRQHVKAVAMNKQGSWTRWERVRSRGFAGKSFWRALGLLRIEGPARKRPVAIISKQAEAASWGIWIKWNERWQRQPGDGHLGNIIPGNILIFITGKNLFPWQPCHSMLLSVFLFSLQKQHGKCSQWMI
ncbi:hypothetical protein N1851_010350 [Merluccius polli]|uniref:Uncharacterized protein n=1 Tax=Merluccius polli TaxID=89951 RepID=A0AA47MZZ2_MERPO|nr:hypothetical protein N1851_010350 [Merluccius polli]